MLLFSLAYKFTDIYYAFIFKITYDESGWTNTLGRHPTPPPKCHLLSPHYIPSYHQTPDEMAQLFVCLTHFLLINRRVCCRSSSCMHAVTCGNLRKIYLQGSGLGVNKTKKVSCSNISIKYRRGVGTVEPLWWCRRLSTQPAFLFIIRSNNCAGKTAKYNLGK